MLGNWDLYCFATKLFVGESGRADIYIWGALVEIGKSNLTMNRLAS